MIKHFSIQPNEESLNTFLDSHQPEEIGYPRIDLIEESGESKLEYKTAPPPHDYSKEYFQLIAKSIGTINITIPKGLGGVDGYNAESISWSRNKKNWETLVLNNTDQTINIQTKSENDTIYFKGIASHGWVGFNDDTNWGTSHLNINSNCRVIVAGNIMSLLYGDDFKNKLTIPNNDIYAFGHNFYGLFKDNKNLIGADQLFLPATTLTRDCYSYMFSGCDRLKTIPKLPATTLANNCYSYMFENCRIKAATDLPATTLASGCYQGMFNSCTSLTSAPELSVTTLAESCYSSMFSGCTSLVEAPELPATALDSYCYSGMFNSCTSLTSAPELPATTLANNCYYNMFKGCTSLTTAPTLPATTLSDSCYYGMFRGCTSLTQAPELPATTLVQNCYREMFYSCRNLNYIKMLATDISASSCLTNWTKNVSSSGTFVKNSAAQWNTTATSSNYYAGIPSGWTVQTATD